MSAYAHQVLQKIRPRKLQTAAELAKQTGLSPKMVADALLWLLDQGSVEHGWITAGGCQFSGWRRKR